MPVIKRKGFIIIAFLVLLFVCCIVYLIVSNKSSNTELIPEEMTLEQFEQNAIYIDRHYSDLLDDGASYDGQAVSLLVAFDSTDSNIYNATALWPGDRSLTEYGHPYIIRDVRDPIPYTPRVSGKYKWYYMVYGVYRDEQTPTIDLYYLQSIDPFDATDFLRDNMRGVPYS